MIISIGEILIDQIESINKNNIKTSERHCGGAPFNVIFNAMKTGAETSFIGAVGNDENGNYLIDFAKKYNFSFLQIQQINKPTTIALVTNDSNGERYFKFIRNDTADYQINYDSIDKNVLSKANIIHLGSLMLNEECGREFADKIVKFAKDNHKLLSFDVNFRTDIFKNKDEAIKIYRKYITAADILKLSEDELSMFTNDKEFEKQIDEIIKPNTLLVVTLGSKGSYYRYNDKYAYVDTFKVDPIDTTGAGDAFFGTLLGLIDVKHIDFNNQEALINALKESNKQGAMTTLFKGAIQ